MNQWEIKQIMDVVSKGINSILINPDKKVTREDIEKWAEFLTETYIKVLERLKKEQQKSGIEAPKLTKDKIDEIKEEAIEHMAQTYEGYYRDLREKEKNDHTIDGDY